VQRPRGRLGEFLRIDPRHLHDLALILCPLRIDFANDVTLEDVRALGFLRPLWGLAFDALYSGSWNDASLRQL
jgi:hypothetical protein